MPLQTSEYIARSGSVIPSLELQSGSCLLINGDSGSGKTSYLRQLVDGLIGNVDGVIAYVPQHPALFPGTVSDNIDFFNHFSNFERSEALSMMMLDHIPITTVVKANGFPLSGGEQQMLSIGRALVSQPSLLLLDEPSLGLAPIIVKQIFDTIKRINKENNTTILLVEQNAFGALKLSDRGYVLVNGKVTISGNSKELLENPEIKKAYLEGA